MTSETPLSNSFHPMADWAPRASQTMPDLEPYMRETKGDVEDTFKALNLPAYRRSIQPLQEFLHHPEEALNSMRTDSCWYQIINSTGRHTYLDIPVKTILNHIKEKSENIAGATIVVSEYLPNVYGGNIVVSQSGQLYAEFGEGTNADYTAGNSVPTHFVSSKFGTDVCEYSFDDPKLRSALWQAISAVRSDGEYQPGYYEFVIADDDGRLRPIFTDARLNNPIYQSSDTDVA